MYFICNIRCGHASGMPLRGWKGELWQLEFYMIIITHNGKCPDTNLYRGIYSYQIFLSKLPNQYL